MSTMTEDEAPPQKRRPLTALVRGPRRVVGAVGRTPRRMSVWGGRRSPRSRIVISVVMGILALAVVTALVLFYVLSYRPAQQTESARVDGLAAAVSRTSQIFTFSPQTIDSDLSRAHDNVAGPFAATFDQTAGDVISSSARQGLTLRTTVPRASVVSAAPDELVALLFLDQESSTNGAPAQGSPSRVQVTVSCFGDQWLITDLKTI